MEESEKELKSFLMMVKEESEIAALKLNIQNTKIMAYHSITSWQIEGEKVEAMTNRSSVLKGRDITLPTKICLIKAMVFPVIMYGWELEHDKGWMPKNWCFRAVVLEKTLESPFGLQGYQSSQS